MHYILTAPQTIHTCIYLPASKSISNRALIMNQLGGNKCTLKNLSTCDDTVVMQRALENLSEITDIGAAGTAMRFLTAYFASTQHNTMMTGTERMKHRPIGVLVDALQELGADITYQGENGFPPLCITGKQLEGGEITLPGNISSQYISALMMIAPYTTKGLAIHIEGKIISKAYLHLTLELMRQFGAEVNLLNERTIIIPPSQYQGIPFTVESDWSGASYWYEMVALCPDTNCHIELPYLHKNSLQGDSEVCHLFEDLGVQTTFTEEGIKLAKTPCQCDFYERDLQNQPDLAQTIVVTCAMLHIPFHIKGLQTLRIKETDRLTALQKELEKLGIRIKEEHGDTLSWDGKTVEISSSPTIDTYEDHRMAMAFAPCAFKFPKLKINHPEVVSKSYPTFWNDLQKTGWTVESVM